MDRRSFLLGLAASTAAVPIAGLVPLADLAPCDLRPGALNFVYGRSLRELAEWQARAIAQWNTTAEVILPPRLRDWPV
jgi:hypothetical protein